MAGPVPLRTVEECQGLEQGQTQEQGRTNEETSAMDNQTGSYPRADIRVSDADRDQAVAELGEHFQAGRLTQEEFDDRSGIALQARTGRDLTGLFTDLPGAAAAEPWAGPGYGPAYGAPLAGPVPRPGRRGGYLPAVRIALGLVIVSIIASNTFGRAHNFEWLVPVIALSFLLLRLSRIRR
jgi:hypothetical protein